MDSCSTEDADPLLSLADQFLDDRAEDAVHGGKPDEDYEQRSREWAAIRPLLLSAPRTFQALQGIAQLGQGTSDAMALCSAVIARTVVDGLLVKETA
jgi:hypothetical protein